MNRLQDIEEEVAERLTLGRLKERYRYAVRCEPSYSGQVESRLVDALEQGTLDFLLLNGVAPGELLKIVAQEFDFGNQIGVAVDLQLAAEPSPMPKVARMLLLLIKKAEESNAKAERLQMELSFATSENLFLREKIKRRSLWNRFKNLFKQKECQCEEEE